MKVTTRKFHENDREKTFQFLKSVFGGWRTIRQWDWKFKGAEKMSGRKAVNWVVEDAGKIVGHLAFIPMELRVENRIIPVCQLVDGALEPKYRHSGVYTNLVQQVLLDAEKEGNLAAFGFANRPSYRIYARLGSFQTLFEITKMFKVLSLRNAMQTVGARLSTGEPNQTGNMPSIKDPLLILGKQAIFTMFELLQNVFSSTVACIVGFKLETSKDGSINQTIMTTVSEERIEGAWKKLSKNYRIAFERDCKYLKWRYNNPESKYDILIAEKNDQASGYVIIACEEKHIGIGKIRISGLRIGHIVDLVAEKELIRPLLSRAEEEFKNRRVCLVTCWAIDGSDSHHLLREMGYYRIPKEIGKITMIANVHSSYLKRTISSIRSNNVLVMMGDSDLV